MKCLHYICTFVPNNTLAYGVSLNAPDECCTCQGDRQGQHQKKLELQPLDPGMP